MAKVKLLYVIYRDVARSLIEGCIFICSYSNKPKNNINTIEGSQSGIRQADQYMPPIKLLAIALVICYIFTICIVLLLILLSPLSTYLFLKFKENAFVTYVFFRFLIQQMEPEKDVKK